MRRLRLLFLMLMLVPAIASAQGGAVLSGSVLESDTSLPVIQAGVQILSTKDSSNVAGTVTDNNGRFVLRIHHGQYILKVSYMGYSTRYSDIHVPSTAAEQDLGNIALEPQPEFLEAAKVVSKVQPVTVAGDTVIYNPAAYRLAEDATLEDLLKKIPGLEVNGSAVTLHGRRISELRIDGKRFFGGDVRAALHNLTADMVDKINAYERESDFTRTTGIDDGESVPVLDLKVKKHMMNGWRGDTNVGLGTSSRYSVRATARKFTKAEQNTVAANINNLSGHISLSNATRTQLGNGSAGDADKREIGYSFARDLPNLDIDGNVHYYGQYRQGESHGQTQTVLASGGSFSNSIGNSLGWQDTPKAEARIEWHPTPDWTLSCKPSINFTRNDTWSHTVGGNFKVDPYDVVTDPYDHLSIAPMSDPLECKRNNSTDNSQENYNGKLNQSVVASASRRLASKKGRSISFQIMEASYHDASYQGVSNRTYYYKTSVDTTRRQYIESFSNNFSFHLQLAYSEPLGKGIHLQFLARQEFKSKTSSKSVYDIASLGRPWQVECGRSRGSLKASLPDGYEASFMDGPSSYGEYYYHNTIFNANVRLVRKKYSLTAGLKFNPQFSVLKYPVASDIETMRNSVFNMAPNITYNYKAGKNRKISLTYRSYNDMPSVYNLLPVVNGTNPLYVHIGNPDLKPAFNHVVESGYNSANMKKQTSFIVNMNARLTQNLTSNSTIYDPDTGGRTVTPKNIDGNWGVGGSMAYTKTFRNNLFSLSQHASGQYNNYASYLYNNKSKSDDVNTTRRLMVKESLDGTFRNSWLELTANLNGQYTGERSLLRPDMNQDPWAVGAGLNTVIMLEDNTRIHVEYSALAQRGFAYDEFNRNYHVVNAGISHPLFKRKATIKLDGFDLLGALPNLTRSFGSESRTIYTYNGVNRYVMLHFVYRFSIK